MNIIRLRTELADEPKRHWLASAVAACRGNILGIDVHHLDGGRVAEEFVIEFPDGGGAALATALERAGEIDVDIEPLEPGAATDPVARAVDVAAGLFAAGSPDSRVAACLARLLQADAVRVVDEYEALASALWAQALRMQTPVVGRARADRVEPALVLVVPDAAGPRRRLFVVERSAPPFSASEIDRARALLRLAAAASRAPSGPGMGPPTPLRRRRRGSVFLRRPGGVPAATVVV